MELIVDYDEMEQELAAIEDPNKKTWFNEAVWRALGVLVAIFTIQYATSTIHFSGGTWYWDYNTFFLLLLGAIPSLIIIGLKVEAGQKKYFQKIKLMNYRKEEVEALKLEILKKNKELVTFKQELSDTCATLAANAEALNEVE